MLKFEAEVPRTFSGNVRLDNYLASMWEGMNRSKLKAGLFRLELNGKESKLSSKIRAGDRILAEWEDSVPSDIAPEDIPLKVIYEDSDVCVLDKAQGMVTHPAAGNWSGTLVNALLFHWGRGGISAEGEEGLAALRPGIVHRLDKDTSGVIITAKTREAKEFLHAQFLRRAGIVKEYIAICHGIPKPSEGVIRTQIVRDRGDRKKFRAVTDSSAGKYAETEYRAFAAYGNFSLVRLRLRTGRTHQIRVHMKFIGCPIVGDPIYSSARRLPPELQSATLMLHARMLEIGLPCGKRMRFVAAVPLRFKRLLVALTKEFEVVRLIS